LICEFPDIRCAAIQMGARLRPHAHVQVNVDKAKVDGALVFKSFKPFNRFAPFQIVRKRTCKNAVMLRYR
jgi:hypothetical protein